MIKDMIYHSTVTGYLRWHIRKFRSHTFLRFQCGDELINIDRTGEEQLAIPRDVQISGLRLAQHRYIRRDLVEVTGLQLRDLDQGDLNACWYSIGGDEVDCALTGRFRRELVRLARLGRRTSRTSKERPANGNAQDQSDDQADR